MTGRRKFLQSTLGLLFAAGELSLASGRPHAQEPWPTRTLTIVVPFPAGGATTTLARVLAEHLKTALGQSIVVENVGGASGSIGTTRVARAAPDGYTLSFGNWASHVGSGAMIPLQFDLLKDLEPVAFLANSPRWVVAKKDLSRSTLRSSLPGSRPIPTRPLPQQSASAAARTCAASTSRTQPAPSSSSCRIAAARQRCKTWSPVKSTSCATLRGTPCHGYATAKSSLMS